MGSLNSDGTKITQDTFVTRHLGPNIQRANYLSDGKEDEFFEESRIDLEARFSAENGRLDGSHLRLKFDATDLSSMSLSATDDVVSWTDTAGSGLTLNTLAGLEPKLLRNEAGPGKHGIDFVLANIDLMQTDAGQFSEIENVPLVPFTMVAVAKADFAAQRAGGQNGTIFWIGDRGSTTRWISIAAQNATNEQYASNVYDGVINGLGNTDVDFGTNDKPSVIVMVANDPLDRKLYLNGILIAQSDDFNSFGGGPFAKSIVTASGQGGVGLGRARDASPGQGYDGIVYETRFYDTNLTESEIFSLTNILLTKWNGNRPRVNLKTDRTNAFSSDATP